MVTRLRARARVGRDAFTALSDPTRRAIVELLWAGEVMTAGAIAARFPRLSRTAVSKHLRVLKVAGVVAVRAHGRERWYSIDTRALGDVDAWIERYRASWQRRLAVVA
jgi:DNA-binding transcriptional ArsR family regulator